MIGHVVLVEITSSQNRNGPGSEIIGSYVVVGSCGPFVDRQNLAVSAGIKCVTGGGGDERNVAADCCALETWNCAQRSESSFHETLARGLVGIRRLRQGHEPDPEIFGPKPDVLPTQLYKTGDEQRRAREQRNRQGDLRAD